MGWYGLAMTVAMAAGPLLGTWTLDGYTFSGVFLLAVALTVAALLAVAGPRLPFQRPEVRRKIALYDPAALPVSLAVVFLTFAYGAVTTFVPLFAVTIDVNPGLYFLVYALSLTLARPIAGKLSDRYGAASVIVPAALLSICALFVLSSATGLAGVVAAAVLYGLGFGSAQPALQAALLGMVPKERFGLANASFFTAFDLGIALGSTLLGWVADLVSYRALFALSTLAVALSLAVFIAYVRPLLRRREGAAA